jgi:hypothetical protein
MLETLPAALSRLYAIQKTTWDILYTKPTQPDNLHAGPYHQTAHKKVPHHYISRQSVTSAVKLLNCNTSHPFSDPMVTSTRTSPQYPRSLRKTRTPRKRWINETIKLISLTLREEQTTLPGYSQTIEPNDDPSQTN